MTFINIMNIMKDIINNRLYESYEIPTESYMSNLYYSSYIFLIPLIYSIYYKLYIISILTLFLFITSTSFWSDYNNKFKLSCDEFIIFLLFIYLYFMMFKMKYYSVSIICTIYMLVLYFTSFYYKIEKNYLYSSNIWINAHISISIFLMVFCNKLLKHKIENRK